MPPFTPPEPAAPLAPTAEPLPPPAAPPAGPLAFLDRDHSILAFNERVFHWAERSDVPLLERLRYLCIVSSNLDEFFEVRATAHTSAAQNGDTQGDYTSASFEALMAHAQDLVARQYKLYNEALAPALAAHGLRIVSHGVRSAEQRRWVQEYFQREVRPLLVPVGLDPAHPFPLVANKSLNFIVRLKGQDAFGRANEIAIVRVPRALPRVIRMPARVAPAREQLFVLLSSIIRAHLGDLFPGREVTEFSQFRVTRHSDLAVDEEDVGNLRTALRQGLQQRHFGQAVRLEVSAGCSRHLSDFLQTQFNLPQGALFRVHGPVNLVRLGQMVDLAGNASLLFPPWRAAWPQAMVAGSPVMAQMRERDLLLHHPFESFDAVLAFLREAVNDPNVLVIKQTIYRTGADSELMELLREAVRRGKEVMAVVELKARFDEEANINWAEALEAIGAQVVYGVVGLKTHAKMLLVTRREGRSLRRYGHLMRALVRAGQQGARIDLIVRGACMLRAQVPGATDNIRVRSIIGRFLEHTRVFYFGAGEQEDLFLSSADWMNRNMLRRVELAWPVTDPQLRQRIIDECLTAYLLDEQGAWQLRPDGSYAPPAHPLDGVGAQSALMARYGQPSKTPGKKRK